MLHLQARRNHALLLPPWAVLLLIMMMMPTQGWAQDGEDPAVTPELEEAEEAEEVVVPVQPPVFLEPTPVLRSAQAFSQRLLRVERVLGEAKASREEASTVEAIQSADARITELAAEREHLLSNLDRLVSGLASEDVEAQPGQTVDLESEITELLAPLLQQLKSATAAPRRMDTLRVRQAHYESLLPRTDEALGRVVSALATARDPGLASSLEELKLRWDERTQMIQDELSLVNAELSALESQRRSFLETSQDIVKVFFASRGRNLILSLLAFVAMFGLVQFAYRMALQAVMRRQKKNATTWLRLIHLMSYIASSGLGFAALLFVLYAAGDWVLLTLASLLLVGLAWGARQGIPRAATEMKTLLNLGTVREGERVIYNGLPYKVASLGLQTWLENPASSGMRLRLPLSQLTSLLSRPCLDDEPWFPCREGDWVLMEGGRFDGQVTLITPEWVTAQGRGGERTWRTTDFSDQMNQNLSSGYRHTIQIGLDYDHQRDVPATIPEQLKAQIAPRISEHPLGEHLQRLIVRYATSLDSALEVQVLLDFSGEAASDYYSLRAHLESIVLDVCVAQGWGYAFPQVVLHQKTP
jgi:hypothetical protein